MKCEINVDTSRVSTFFLFAIVVVYYRPINFLLLVLIIKKMKSVAWSR